MNVQFTKKAYKEFQKINKVNSKQFDQLFNALKELEKNPNSNKFEPLHLVEDGDSWVVSSNELKYYQAIPHVPWVLIIIVSFF